MTLQLDIQGGPRGIWEVKLGAWVDSLGSGLGQSPASLEMGAAEALQAGSWG